MGNWPAAVLFDFDGVIVNSEPVHLRAFQLAAHSEGIDLSADEYYSHLIGFDDAGAWRRIFQLHGRSIDPAALNRAMAAKFGHMRQLLETKQIPALPGARELIAALARHGRPMAICSGAVRHEIMTMLWGVGLVEHFPIITASEDVPVGKPDPSGYLLTARRLSEMIRRPLPPHECLVIEDAPAVIRSVRGVGFKALGVATSYPLQQLGGADWAVQTLRADDLRAVPQLYELFNVDWEIE